MKYDTVIGSAFLWLASAAAVGADVVEFPSVADNTLYQDAGGAISNGAGQHFFAGTNSDPLVRRGVIRFDLSDIPSGATVTGVTLALHVSRSAGNEPELVSLHRLLGDWGEGSSDADGAEGGGAPATSGSATWVHSFFDWEYWGASGGNFEASAGAESLVGDIGYYAWTSPELVAEVQAWVSGKGPNWGWLVKGEELAASTAKRFDTRENPDPTVRPVLTVEYVPTPAAFLLFPVASAMAGAARPHRTPRTQPPRGASCHRSRGRFCAPF